MKPNYVDRKGTFWNRVACSVLAAAIWIVVSVIIGLSQCNQCDAVALREWAIVNNASGQAVRVSCCQWISGEYVEAVRGSYVGGPGDFSWDFLLPEAKVTKHDLDQQVVLDVVERLNFLKESSTFELSCVWQFGWPVKFVAVFDVKNGQSPNSSTSPEGIVSPFERSSAKERYISIEWRWTSVLLCISSFCCVPIVLRLAGYVRAIWNRKLKNRCHCCGYSITGLVASVCPECGTSIAASTVRVEAFNNLSG